jgi:hypothetical protein
MWEGLGAPDCIRSRGAEAAPTLRSHLHNLSFFALEMIVD